MKVSAISDVHVKVPHDDADHLLCHFLTNPLVASSDYIVLLGDIFDLMCGPHEEYLKSFGHIFDLMDQLQKKGKKVLFYEGNHDVHLKELFKKRWPKDEIVPNQGSDIFQIESKLYYFSHGDEHEIHNPSYQKYKAFITSEPLKYVANNVMPYKVLNFLGERASKMSRKRGSRTFNPDPVRDAFRKGVAQTTEGRYDFVLGGHSHVKDNYSLNEHSIYLNNGYALKEKTFIHIDNHKVSFEPLS